DDRRTVRARYGAHPDPAPLDQQRGTETENDRDREAQHPHLERVVRHLEVDPSLHTVEAHCGAVVQADVFTRTEILPSNAVQPTLLHHALVDVEDGLPATGVQSQVP